METTRAYVTAALERSGVRVATLVRLRWIAVAGQTATVCFVGLYLGFPVPWAALAAAILASAVLNIGLTTLYPRNARLEGGEALLHLVFDVLQGGVLLFLTGGLSNPFAMLLLVPITIGATLLSARGIAMLVGLGLLVLLVEWRGAMPLPWHGRIDLPDIYRFGVLVAVAIGLAFLAAYIWLVSAESRRRAMALAATQSALERESKMSALGSLAAAAAHELGGPLGTITLIARELVDQLGDDPDFGADVRLLDQEAARSRAILVGIAKRAEAEEPFPLLGLDVLLHEVAHGVRPARVPVFVVASAACAIRIRRSPELLHGLSNIVANAVRHAGSAVTVRANATSSEIHVAVVDDGSGFDPAVLPRLGEPFLGPSVSGSGGTGLGIFIAATLLERTGASIRFGNRPGGGAEVDIRWPRTHIESGAFPS
jgi:two-component system, sensor histidine kinase RegB